MDTRDWIDFAISETESALTLLYSYQAFYRLLSSEEAVSAANENRDFWRVHTAALQKTLFLYLGRLSDDSKDGKSFSDFRAHCIQSINNFSIAEFLKRRPNILELNANFLDDSVEPSANDLKDLFKEATPHNKYLRAEAKSIRSKVIAHAILTEEHEYEHLFKQVDLAKVEDALLTLWSISKDLWDCYHNARTIEPAKRVFTEKDRIFACTERVLKPAI